MKKIVDIRDIYIYEDGTVLNFSKSEIGNYYDIILEKRKLNIDILSCEKKIVYEDGSEWTSPFSAGIEIINKERTELLVIFPETPTGQSKTPPWYFPPPNNAAIYYSDGTLKHQITIPRGADGDFIFTRAGHSVKYPHLKTVILQFTNPKINKGGWYHLYAIDPDVPELIHTGQMIKW